MSKTIHGPRGRARSGTLAGALCVVLGLLSSAAHAQQGQKYFKNYFVTGDYVAAGVGLKGTGVNGLATGTITIPTGAIPAGAEIVAAYLYWETVGPASGPVPATLAGATFKKNDLSRIAVLTNPGGSPGCSGDGDNDADDSAVYVYRADVLPYLPRVQVAGGAGSQPQVVTQATGAHQVTLPDSGNRWKTPQTLGAGLVIVYQVAGYNPAAATPYGTPNLPLKSIVLFDGGVTLNRHSPLFSTVLEGFYEASRAAPGARLTQIVGNGTPGLNVTVNLTSTLHAADNVLVATNPFVGAGGGGNAPGAVATGFDVVTFNNAPLVPGAMKAGVSVAAGPRDPCGCLTFGSTVLSTVVQDRDGDGLLDVWEAQSEWTSKPANLASVYASWPLIDPTGVPLPNLQAMGANPDVQDVFLQVDTLVGADGHTHLPAKSALDAVATAFHNAAPRPSLVAAGECTAGAAPGQCPIAVHFDVGANYQPAATVTPAACASAATWTPDCAIVPLAAGALGGNTIAEVPCLVNPANPNSGLTPGGATCAFPGFAGVVGWKNGLRAYRDAPVNPATRAPCAAGATGCVPRFARNRKDIFHYALFAHALGLASPTNPLVPRKTSGIADVDGGDLMVTLGLWDPANPAGTPFVQASTLMHELGHNFGLRHGGVLPTGALEANCKPNYQSVMNYLFQVSGLYTTQGVPTIDYSRQTLPTLNEGALSEGTGFGAGATPAYMGRWYAPQAGSFLNSLLNTTPASRRCDGTPVAPTDPPYVRIDADPRLGGALDWNANGVIDAATVSEDANLDGVLNETFTGANDFATMDLRQTGARRSIGSRALSYSVVDPVTGIAPVPPAPPIGGGLSLDTTGYGDLGYGDLGYGDLGYGDLGYGDLGYGDLGYGDLGYGDLGYGDLGAPDNGPTGSGDITFETAVTVASAPSALEQDTSSVPGTVALGWTPPPILSGVSYQVYRVVGAGVTPANLAKKVLVATTTTPAFTDTFKPCPTASEWDTDDCQAITYTYFVVSSAPDPNNPGKTIQSGPSNFVTVTATVYVPDRWHWWR